MREPITEILRSWGPWKRWTSYQHDVRLHHEQLTLSRKKDVEANQRGSLSGDESVQVPAIWVAELYTPSTVGGLRDGLIHLGWEREAGTPESPETWIQYVREGRAAGSKRRAEAVQGNTSHYNSGLDASLPFGVTGVRPNLISLTPSLTILVIAFLFDEKTACSLEDVLRADFATQHERDTPVNRWLIARHVLTGARVPEGRIVRSPDSQRSESVNNMLKKLETSCVGWCKDRLPGAFSSLQRSVYPTAALFITKESLPLSSEGRDFAAFKCIGFNRAHAFKSEEWPEVSLVMPWAWNGEGNRLMFSCRRRDALSGEQGRFDPTSNSTIVIRADDAVCGLLSRWALNCLLDSYRADLAAIRDLIARDDRYHTVRDLKALRSLTRTIFYDISVITKETSELSESAMHYLRDVDKMSYYRDMPKGGRLQLLEELRSSLRQRAGQVNDEATLMSSMLANSSNLTQSISNITLQYFVLGLTIFSIVIAMLSLCVAVFDLGAAA